MENMSGRQIASQPDSRIALPCHAPLLAKDRSAVDPAGRRGHMEPSAGEDGKVATVRPLVQTNPVVPTYDCATALVARVSRAKAECKSRGLIPSIR